MSDLPDSLYAKLVDGRLLLDLKVEFALLISAFHGVSTGLGAALSVELLEIFVVLRLSDVTGGAAEGPLLFGFAP